MLTFGVSLIWAWRLLRTGDGRRLLVVILIGVLYVGIGAFGLVYRAGDPFMGFLVALSHSSYSLRTHWHLARSLIPRGQAPDGSG